MIKLITIINYFIIKQENQQLLQIQALHQNSELY